MAEQRLDPVAASVAISRGEVWEAVLAGGASDVGSAGRGHAARCSACAEVWRADFDAETNCFRRRLVRTLPVKASAVCLEEVGDDRDGVHRLFLAVGSAEGLALTRIEASVVHWVGAVSLPGVRSVRRLLLADGPTVYAIVETDEVEGNRYACVRSVSYDGEGGGVASVVWRGTQEPTVLFAHPQVVAFAGATCAEPIVCYPRKSEGERAGGDMEEVVRLAGVCAPPHLLDDGTVAAVGRAPSVGALGAVATTSGWLLLCAGTDVVHRRTLPFVPDTMFMAPLDLGHECIVAHSSVCGNIAIFAADPAAGVPVIAEMEKVALGKAGDFRGAGNRELLLLEDNAPGYVLTDLQRVVSTGAVFGEPEAVGGQASSGASKRSRTDAAGSTSPKRAGRPADDGSGSGFGAEARPDAAESSWACGPGAVDARLSEVLSAQADAIRRRIARQRALLHRKLELLNAALAVAGTDMSGAQVQAPADGLVPVTVPPAWSEHGRPLLSERPRSHRHVVVKDVTVQFVPGSDDVVISAMVRNESPAEVDLRGVQLGAAVAGLSHNRSGRERTVASYGDIVKFLPAGGERVLSTVLRAAAPMCSTMNGRFVSLMILYHDEDACRCIVPGTTVRLPSRRVANEQPPILPCSIFAPLWIRGTSSRVKSVESVVKILSARGLHATWQRGGGGGDAPRGAGAGAGAATPNEVGAAHEGAGSRGAGERVAPTPTASLRLLSVPAESGVAVHIHGYAASHVRKAASVVISDAPDACSVATGVAAQPSVLLEKVSAAASAMRHLLRKLDAPEDPAAAGGASFAKLDSDLDLAAASLLAHLPE